MDGARYLGSLCHVVEDWACPAHVIPGDNMLNLMRQLLPPSDGMESVLLHGAIESRRFELTLGGYRPRRFESERIGMHVFLASRNPARNAGSTAMDDPLDRNGLYEPVFGPCRSPSLRDATSRRAWRTCCSEFSLFTVLSLAREAASSPPSAVVLSE